MNKEVWSDKKFNSELEAKLTFNHTEKLRLQLTLFNGACIDT